MTARDLAELAEHFRVVPHKYIQISLRLWQATWVVCHEDSRFVATANVSINLQQFLPPAGELCKQRHHPICLLERAPVRLHQVDFRVIHSVRQRLDDTLHKLCPCYGNAHCSVRILLLAIENSLDLKVSIEFACTFAL